MKLGFVESNIDSQGLVFHYKLWTGPTSPGKIFDYSHSGNLGSLVGSAIRPVYPGFLFNGVDDFINVASPSKLPTGTTLRTTCMWIKTSLPSVSSTTLVWGGAGAGEIWKEFINSTTGYHYVTVFGGNIRGNINVADNVWHHLAVTSDTGTVEGCKLYVDGQDEGKSGSIPEPLQTTGSPLYVGIDTDESTGPFAGRLDDIRIYNRMLIAEEIRSIYELTRWRYAA